MSKVLQYDFDMNQKEYQTDISLDNWPRNRVKRKFMLLQIFSNFQEYFLVKLYFKEDISNFLISCSHSIVD